MTRKLMVSLLVGSCFVTLMAGCMSSQPAYSVDGQYIGHREQVDSGKTLGALGDFMLGVVPFGRNVQATRNAAIYGTTLRTIGNATQYDNRNEVVHYVNVAR